MKKDSVFGESVSNLEPPGVLQKKSVIVNFKIR
jgi:hypothetical protein